MSILRPIFLCASSLIVISSAVGFADDATQPDNSRVNQRDQSTKEVTSQNQGSSKGDIELTRRIRREVVNQKTFSSDAKNIKIITIEGIVTLKGPVKSVSEKKQIEKVAKRIAGPEKVTSEIEIAQ